MKVTLLGATGFVGGAILNEAMNRGHTVLAIARHPEKIRAKEHLIVKAGDVYDAKALAVLIRGWDAVISAFNPGWKTPSLYTEQVKGRPPSLPQSTKQM